MANYLIEQLENVINILNPDSSEILRSFGLDCVVAPQYGSKQRLNFYADDTPGFTFAFTGSVIQTKDLGGGSVVFAGTFEELINKINSEYFTGYGSSSGGDLAKQSSFDPKFTGYVIDLDDSTADPFGDFPFNLESFTFSTFSKMASIEVSNFKTFPLLKRIEDLVSLLNATQPYYFFIKLSATVIGILDGELPVSTLKDFAFIDDTNSSTTLYEDFPYIIATDSVSTQDLMLNELRYSNFLRSGNNGRKAVEEPSVAASAIAVQLTDENPYRKTLTITNTSSSALYLQVNGTPTTSEYKYKLLTDDILIVDDTTEEVNGIWELGTTDGTALVNITY